jgi:centromeric protein E
MHVCVRLRHDDAMLAGERSPWAVVDDTTLADVEESQERQFGFEHVFGPESKNRDVYEHSVRPVVEQALRGVNGSVFAYGQTNSGKTHTITGVRSDPGLLWRAVQHIFEGIRRQPARVFRLRCSYFEIYNEETRDLLDMDKGALQIREKAGKFFIDNLTATVVTSTSQIVDIVRRGEANRSFGVSNLHEHSSRSHTIFRVLIESALRADADPSTLEPTAENAGSGGGKQHHKQLSMHPLRGPVQLSELNLVDLAGSECLSQAPHTGQHRETIHINLSLTQLKSVIQALSRGADHVPFRNSALTKIMRNSLGGNSRTLVLCTLSPLAVHRRQSRMTLLFGELAKRIENRPRINVDAGATAAPGDAAALVRYRLQIDELTDKLSGLEELERQKLEISQAYARLREQVEVYKTQSREREALSREMRSLTAAGEAEAAGAGGDGAAARGASEGGAGAGAGGTIAGVGAGAGAGTDGGDDWAGMQELGDQINSAVAVSVVTHAGQGLVVIRETYQAPSGETRFGAEGIALSLENWAKLKGVIPNIDADIDRYVRGSAAARGQ